MENVEDQLTELEDSNNTDIEESDGTESNILIEALEGLSVSFDENPNLESQIKEVMEFYLKGDITVVDPQECFSALEFLIPSKSALFLYYCCLYGSNTYLNTVEETINQIPLRSSKEIISFLKLIMALYNTKVKAVNRKNFNDWKWMSSSLSITEDKLYSLELDILKNNHEQIYLKMSVSSAFNFIGKIIEQLNEIPSEEVSEEIPSGIGDIMSEFSKKFIEIAPKEAE